MSLSKHDDDGHDKHDDGHDDGHDDEHDAPSDASGTDTEIAQRQTQSRKTLKRKRRATSPSRFGAALEALLSTTAGPAGVAAPLSLRPEVARRQKEARLERGARKVLEGEKKEQEEKGRVKDVIGGWGVDGERALRKVAQRGVITLFNAVQHAQGEAATASTAARAQRGTGKATLPAPDGDQKRRGVGLASDAFLDMIRAGAVVGKG